MLSAAARSRLAVVLVGARNPQNIGAAARAMHDFGFADLRVVNPFTPPFEAARLDATSAVNAGNVMRSARIFSTLPEALADCGMTAGTTAIGERGLTHSPLPLQEGGVALLRALTESDGNRPDGPKVALLFGSEKTGLTRDELSFCSELLTIPMFAPEGRHLSMNLGQAVAVCLYELTRSGFEGARALPEPQKSLPTQADRERVLTMLLEVMQRSGYERRFPANARPEIVRQLSLQLGSTPGETATWMGVLRQLLRVLPASPNESKQKIDLEAPDKMRPI